MYRLLSMVWREARDPTSYLSVDNCCALYSFSVTFRANLTAGSEVQPSPMQLNSMDMCCSYDGASDQQARPLHPGTLWRRQVQIDGNPDTSAPGAGRQQKLKILFLCKENSATKSFADLLLWLDPPSGVLGRIGRLVGDQERNKSSYSHTKFDINPRERRQMLSKCQLIMATGGTVAQDLTMPWSTLSGFMQDLSLMVIDEGQQYGTDREIATISLLKQQPLVLWTGDAQQTPGGIARTAPNAKRSRQLLLAKKTRTSERQKLLHAFKPGRSKQ